MEQRECVRTKISGTEVYISDGAGFCQGTLKDFSRFGLCITDIPRKIHLKHGYFTAVVSDNSQNFKLKIVKKWIAKDGLSTVVGGAIENVPWDWTEMVMQHEPQKKEPLSKTGKKLRPY